MYVCAYTVQNNMTEQQDDSDAPGPLLGAFSGEWNQPAINSRPDSRPDNPPSVISSGSPARSRETSLRPKLSLNYIYDTMQQILLTMADSPETPSSAELETLLGREEDIGLRLDGLELTTVRKRVVDTVQTAREPSPITPISAISSQSEFEFTAMESRVTAQSAKFLQGSESSKRERGVE